MGCYALLHCITSQKSEDLIHTVAETWSHTKYIRLCLSNINPAWLEIKIKLTDILRNTCFYKTVTKYTILVGKLEGNGPLGKPRCRWGNNIKMGLIETGCKVMDWTDLTRDMDKWQVFMSTVMNLLEVWGISWIAEELLTSHNEIWSM